jgi:hypothetical protein
MPGDFKKMVVETGKHCHLPDLASKSWPLLSHTMIKVSGFPASAPLQTGFPLRSNRLSDVKYQVSGVRRN